MSDKCIPALLGGRDCHRLGIVKRVHAMQNEVSGDDETMRREVNKKYTQLDQGSGTLPGVHTIVLKDGATGVVHAPRRVAVAKRAQLKKEIDRQVEVGFLAKVNEPTGWVNALVIAEKSNWKMRLCIDPKDLNKEIKSVVNTFKYQPSKKFLESLQMHSVFRNWMQQLGYIKYEWPDGRFHKTVHRFLEDCEGTSVYMDDITCGAPPSKNTTKTSRKHSRNYLRWAWC